LEEKVIRVQQELEELLKVDPSILLVQAAPQEVIREAPEVLVLTVVPVELGVQMKLEDAVYLQEVVEVAEKPL
jgi:hypothetical protein